MSNFILTGLFTEGTTDVRFLKGIVENTLESLAYECTGVIETDVEIITIEKTGLSFLDQISKAIEEADSIGALILFIHTDADDYNDKSVFQNKIIPAIDFLKTKETDNCNNIVAIVPVVMTEAWMLADKNLLKGEIGIQDSDANIGINKNPEEINNPKAVIENIIRISKEADTKRKRSKGLHISDLYQIIGQTIEVSKLDDLPSYNKFRNSLKEALKDLNFLHN